MPILKQVADFLLQPLAFPHYGALLSGGTSALQFGLLGGDSIKAILASSKLKTYNIHIDAKDLYDYPTIAALTRRKTQQAVQIDQSEIQGDVPLTPIQKWFFEKHFDTSGHFNQAVMIFRQDKLDQEIIRAAMEVLLFQHDALRMIFVDSEQGIRQINRAYQPGLFLMEVVTGDAVSLDEINKTQAAIDLRKGPLVGLNLFRTPAGDHLLLVLHHLIVDGISWRILIEDFITLYQQLAEGAELELPDKTHAFKEWALALTKYAAGEKLAQEKKYWKALEARQIPALPTDVSLLPSERKYRDTEEVSICLAEKQTEELIHRIHFAYNTEINDILLAALALALKKWRGISLTKINLEGHGREALIEGLNIERTVGWFTAQSPVIIDLTGCDEISSLIRSTKETLRKIPNKGVGYSLLKYLAPQVSNLFGSAEPEISFNYLGHIIEGELEGFSLSENNLGQNISREASCPHKLLINGITVRNKLEVIFTFNRKEFKRESITALADIFKTSLETLIAHCLSQEHGVRTASDFTSPDLGEEELEDILRQL